MGNIVHGRGCHGPTDFFQCIKDAWGAVGNRSCVSVSSRLCYCCSNSLSVFNHNESANAHVSSVQKEM